MLDAVTERSSAQRTDSAVLLRAEHPTSNLDREPVGRVGSEAETPNTVSVHGTASYKMNLRVWCLLGLFHNERKDRKPEETVEKDMFNR